MAAHSGAVFIFPSNPDMVRNSDVHYPFRQDSHFFYLTGLEEADACIVLAPSKTKPGGYKFVLFLQPRDPEREMWEGERYGIEGAQRVFGADEAYPIQEFDKRFPELLAGSDRVFYRMGIHPDRDRQMTELFETCRRNTGRTGRSLVTIEDPSAPVGEMRLYKAPEEIESMRKACHISAMAHKAAMREVKPGMNEREMEALVDYYTRKEGCLRLGYPSIVAGGKNAACLHYRSNNETLRDGDLLLIDAGGEYDHYSADITRTFPVGRKFTKAQAQVYDLVLRSQKETIAMVRPGVTLPAIHKTVCQIIIEGLLSLGLLKGNPDSILTSGAYKRFYPHNTSHWLGMDVHDVGLYIKNGEPRALEAGMVFTIEPGFYVQPADKETPGEYHGIGIRIEDDILVTASGSEVMTGGVPKERDEIEALRT